MERQVVMASLLEEKNELVAYYEGELARRLSAWNVCLAKWSAQETDDNKEAMYAAMDRYRSADLDRCREIGNVMLEMKELAQGPRRFAECEAQHNALPPPELGQ